MEQKLKILESDLSELQLEMNSSQEKQSELLSFTAKLTEKNTQLQSENVNFIEKLEQMQNDLDKANALLNEFSFTKKNEVSSNFLFKQIQPF
jgi:multidrug resistance efflux pump